MIKQANELIFISQILRDGSGTREMHPDYGSDSTEEYHLERLSITHDTWIACAFNSYVVKLRK